MGASEDCAERVKRALAALKVLSVRTRAVLTALDGEDLDASAELFRQKSEAFHNFRALEHIARESGKDLGKDAAARATWKEIEALDQMVRSRLEAARETVRVEASKVADLRRTLSRYRSQELPKSGFAKTV